MYKKAVDRRTTPISISGETFTIALKDGEYKALLTEDPQENTPTTTFACLKDMTARSGCTTSNILVNEAIDSTQASIWVGQKLGFNGEMRTIASVTQGTAGNASFSVTAFSTAPTAGNDIYSPRKEQRDNNAVSTNYFKVAMNDVGQPLPILLFNAVDVNKTGMVEEKGLGTTLTSMYEDQVSDMYDKTQTERRIVENTLTDLNTNHPPIVDLEGTTGYVRTTKKIYSCVLNQGGTAYEWAEDFAAPNSFGIASTNVSGGTLSTNGNVIVTFTEEAAISTVNSTNFKIKDGSAVEQASTLTLGADNKTVTINPNADLAAGSYTLTVDSVTDIYGRLLPSTQIYSFTTVVDPAPTVPTITASATSNGAITAKMTVASTDATPETVLYDYYVDDAVVVGHTDLSEAQALLDRIVVTGLGVTTAHTVKLVAKDAHGNTATSNVVNVTIPLQAPPAISVTPSNAQNTIAFTEDSTLTGETYDIYWSTTATVAADIRATGTKIPGVTSPVTHSPLTNNTQYNYISVMNYNGVESSPSAVVSGTPSNGVNISFDGAANSAIDTRLTPMTAGSGTARINGNGQLELITTATSDGAVVYRTNAITKTDVKTYKRKFMYASGSPAMDSDLNMFVYDLAAKVAPGTIPAWIVGCQIINASGVLKVEPIYKSNADVLYYWDNGGSAWTTGASTDATINFDTYYWIYLVTDATGFKYIVKDATDTTVITQTTQVPWTSVKALTNSAYLAFGDIRTDAGTGKSLTDQYVEI